MINTSNYASKDNPPPPLGPVPRPRLPAGATVMDRPEVDRPPGRSAKSRIWYGLVLAVGVALDWVAYLLRRWGDRWFAMNDTEAYWRGWQITKTAGGLGRRYRDLRFDTLATCTRCVGAGVWGDETCGPCLGTGRITVREVS